MEIVYLLNSGFMIRDEQTLLVFDDYDDPAKIVSQAVNQGDFENLYIFASHAHFDHFDTHIRAYADQVTRYIFSYDIKRTKRVKIFPAENITFMRKYNYWNSEGVKIWTYDSTDVGVSFLIETSSRKKIFHAGDFNWWHWADDSEENQKIAERVFKNQMKRLNKLKADIAFFPVDGRLGEFQEKGVKEFMKQNDIKALTAMHRVGFPAWIPSRNFVEEVGKIPYWSPTYSGEYKTFKGGKFLK